MRKIVMILSVMILALNLNPFGQTFTHAKEDAYDNIASGEYNIIAKALNADSDEASGAAGFINENAVLKINESGVMLTLTVPHNDMAFIEGMQIEGVEATQDGEQWTYKISSLKALLKAQVQYKVPALNMEHDVPFRFSLEGLSDLPVIEEPEEEAPEVEEPEIQEPEVEEPELDEDEDKDKGPVEEEGTELKNGLYTVNAAYLHASKDEASSMGRYLSNPVFLNVQAQKNELTIAINDHQTVTKLTVDGKEPISSKLNGNTRYETFAISNLAEAIVAEVEYQAPFGGSIHYGSATFRIDLALENAKAASADEQPGYGIRADYLNLADGLYSVDAAYINAKNGQNSAMARYLGEKAYISVKEGQAEVYILINDNGTVTKLEVNKQASVDKKVNGKRTLESYVVAPLITEMTGYVEYQAPFNGGTHYGNAEFDIVLNKETIKKEQELPFENEESTEEEDKEQEKPAPEEPKEEKPNEEKPKPEVEKPTVKGYTIDYVVNHATEDEASAADNFFVKPGLLLKKDGKNYLQLTIKNWGMIDWLKVDGKSVTIISEDKDADTATIQFQVSEDLNEILQLSMKVTVPGLYETEHTARLIMDASSLVEDKSGQDYLVQEPSTEDDSVTKPGQSGGNDSTTTPGSSKQEEEGLEKPKFGTNGTVEQTGVEQNTAGAQLNPQTGDNSKILLYSLLLLASMALLAVQYRKRSTVR